jgi:hypothetical protein
VNVAYLSLGQAAKEAGVSKATISKTLKNGRLSYVAKTTAGYEIDPAELFRVFPKKPLGTVSSERSQTPEETAESASLAVEVRFLRERLAELQDERDAWRDQAQRLALAAPDTKRRGWFGR